MSVVSLAKFDRRLYIGSYRVLSEKAKTLLLAFATTYLYESGFSTYLYRNQNEISSKPKRAEPDLRLLQLSKIKPDIAKLCQHTQPHTSH